MDIQISKIITSYVSWVMGTPSQIADYCDLLRLSNASVFVVARNTDPDFDKYVKGVDFNLLLIAYNLPDREACNMFGYTVFSGQGIDSEVISTVIDLFNDGIGKTDLIGSGGTIDSFLLHSDRCTQEQREYITESILEYIQLTLID